MKKVLIISCVVLLIISCTSKTKEELMSDGMKLMGENNPSGALVYFKNALEKDQNFFEARNQLAKAYLAAGKFEQSSQEYQKLVLMNPSLSSLHLELAKAYLYSGKAANALSEINGYLGSQSPSAEALEIQGYAYSANGNHAAAEDSLLKALRMEPARNSARLGLAGVYTARGGNTEAQALINEVINSDAKNIKAYYMLASLQTSMKQRDQALLTYQKLVRINPEDIRPIYQIGLLYVDGKDFDRAGRQAEEIISKMPKGPYGYLLRGIVLYYKNDFNGSIAALQECISRRPVMGAYYFLGLNYYQKGDSELALSQFQQVLNTDPSNVQARTFLALTLFRQQRLENAISEINRILQTEPQNAFAHNLLGSAYMAKGMSDEAMKEFDKVIQLDPKLADVHLKKGLFNVSSGKFREGETELRTAVKIAPEVLNARIILSAYYLRQKDYQKAVSTLREGLNGAKNDALLYNNMAAVLSRQNKLPEAVAFLQKAKEADPDNFAAYTKLAKYYIVKGQNDKAMAEYNAVLQRSHKNVQALISIAMLLELQGKESEAAAFYAKAEDTKDPSAFLAHAGYFMRKKDRGNALDVINSLLKLQPGLTQALEAKGGILFGEKRYKEAMATYEQLETADRDKALAPIINTYIAMKDYGSALTKLDSAIALNPGKVELRAEMARIYLLKGDEKKAIESANRIVELRKDSAFGYVVLASMYESQNELDKAVSALKKGIQVEGRNVDARLKLGDIYAKKKEYVHALGMYDAVIKMNPGLAQPYFAGGVIYEKMDNGKLAVKKYQQAIERAEDFVPAINNLAFLYLRGLGSKEEALELAYKAYRNLPESPEVMDTLGYALIKNRRAGEGLKILQMAAVLLPGNPAVQYHLALAYKETGDIGQAKEAAVRALKSGDFSEAKEARLFLDRLNK